jgi:hypothetical protein
MHRALLCGLISAAAIPLGLAAYQVSPSAFHIAIIDGEGAMNNISGRVAQEPIVEVTDENHKPVRGAYVTFSSSNSGPGVTFSNGSSEFSTTTDDLGHAVAHGIKPNGQTGNFEIHVHVTYQGQTVGDTAIHQVNVTGKVADLSHNLENGGSDAPIGSMGAGVLGVAIGPQFDLNGSQVPDNANLMADAEVVSLDKTVRIHLKDDCDYLLAPNSAAKIEDHKLILEKGKVRTRHSGNCKVAAGLFLISGDSAAADGVIAYSGCNVEVASLNGTLDATGKQGTPAGTVAPGAYSSFGCTQVAGTGAGGGPSGATASTGAAAGTKSLVLYGTTLGVVLAGLGLAVDAILQPGSPTSP